ncbi:hypothetical protein [uncultured Cytophaga sp.]|uniref:hypothetical protein n=1 Tax=uncultured Cytophaga sp. TaxID=160238 RepID=UPI00260205D7|nr:hypothetical protein [uncultured Cytophaga sp.]
METNIFIQIILLVIVTTTILNCQKKIRQGASWAYHISIILSLLLISVSVFMMIAFYKASTANCNYIDCSALIIWGIILLMSSLNLILTKKIEITPTDIVIHPLIGGAHKHNFCKALYFTILEKHDRHCAWKELTICFKEDKVHISSLQHTDFVIIHNQLLYHSIPENKNG